MFLIGLSGSFLPYLILLGIVFVFSIKTNGREIEDGSAEDNAAVKHHINNYTPSQTKGGRSYVFPGNFLREKSFESCSNTSKKHQNAFLPRLMDKEITSIGRLVFGKKTFIKLLSDCYFFGLSPPVCNV